METDRRKQARSHDSPLLFPSPPPNSTGTRLGYPSHWGYPRHWGLENSLLQTRIEAMVWVSWKEREKHRAQPPNPQCSSTKASAVQLQGEGICAGGGGESRPSKGVRRRGGSFEKGPPEVVQPIVCAHLFGRKCWQGKDTTSAPWARKARGCLLLPLGPALPLPLCQCPPLPAATARLGSAVCATTTACWGGNPGPNPARTHLYRGAHRIESISKRVQREDCGAPPPLACFSGAGPLA